MRGWAVSAVISNLRNCQFSPKSFQKSDVR